MSAESQIKATIQTYFDCMYESSADKARDAFHSNAKITGFMGGNLLEMSVTDFANFVAGQVPSPKDKEETLLCEILSIEIAGDTAVARVRDEYMGNTFLDTLSLIKVDETWAIYNKLFHVEKSSA